MIKKFSQKVLEKLIQQSTPKVLENDLKIHDQSPWKII